MKEIEGMNEVKEMKGVEEIKEMGIEENERCRKQRNRMKERREMKKPEGNVGDERNEVAYGNKGNEGG